jgi:hypothetical protein
LFHKQLKNCRDNAGVAQLVEQLIRNQQVSGSNPLAGSIKEKDFPVSVRKILFCFKKDNIAKFETLVQR